MIFGIPWLLLTLSEMYSALIAVWNIFCFFCSLQGIASSRFLCCMYWFNDFLNRSTKSLKHCQPIFEQNYQEPQPLPSIDIQELPRAFILVKNIFHMWYTSHCKPSHSSHIHSTEFTQLQCWCCKDYFWSTESTKPSFWRRLWHWLFNNGLNTIIKLTSQLPALGDQRIWLAWNVLRCLPLPLVVSVDVSFTLQGVYFWRGAWVETRNASLDSATESDRHTACPLQRNA